MISKALAGEPHENRIGKWIIYKPNVVYFRVIKCFLHYDISWHLPNTL